MHADLDHGEFARGVQARNSYVAQKDVVVPLCIIDSNIGVLETTGPGIGSLCQLLDMLLCSCFCASQS